VTLRKLRYGDTIGVVAPSGPDTVEVIRDAIDRLVKLGFRVKEGRHIYDSWGHLAGRDEDRASDFMAMFEDDEVDMVMCLRGGYGAMRVLPYLRFDVIRTHPKILLGYSDITALLNNVTQRCDFVTFHGPVACSNLNHEETLNSLLTSIMNGTAPYTVVDSNRHRTQTNFSGDIEGTLAGGNLTLITSLLGTPFEVDLKDKIVLIEDIGEEPYRIDRMLTQLLLSGRLQQAKGFIIGYFTNCEPTSPQSFTWEQVIEERILSLDKPTILHASVGHQYPNLTMPIGAKVVMDGRGAVYVAEPVVC
jgi:muramoyltetrapeptide carboxypeptidase